MLFKSESVGQNDSVRFLAGHFVCVLCLHQILNIHPWGTCQLSYKWYMKQEKSFLLFQRNEVNIGYRVLGTWRFVKTRKPRVHLSVEGWIVAPKR